MFWAKKNLYKFLIFWVFLHIRGHGFFWKITKFFFESYGPEIHWKLHKWCCGRILKLFRLFRAKKNLYKFLIFWVFLHIRGHGFFVKSLSSFLRVTGPKFTRNSRKWCCQRILKLFRLFRAKNNFCINFSFFEFFCISGVMDFLKKWLSSFFRVTGLKFIGNFTNGVADVF